MNFTSREREFNSSPCPSPWRGREGANETRAHELRPGGAAPAGCDFPAGAGAGPLAIAAIVFGVVFSRLLPSPEPHRAPPPARGSRTSRPRRASPSSTTTAPARTARHADDAFGRRRVPRLRQRRSPGPVLRERHLVALESVGHGRAAPPAPSTTTTAADISPTSRARRASTSPCSGMGSRSATTTATAGPDIFVTGVGGNRLFHNRGDGTFADVTDAAGVGGDDHVWSTGAVWIDIFGDGQPRPRGLQLRALVARGRPAGRAFEAEGRRARPTPSPAGFVSVFPTVYRNMGNGRFAKVSAKHRPQPDRPPDRVSHGPSPGGRGGGRQRRRPPRPALYLPVRRRCPFPQPGRRHLPRSGRPRPQQRREGASGRPGRAPASFPLDAAKPGGEAASASCATPASPWPRRPTRHVLPFGRQARGRPPRL